MREYAEPDGSFVWIQWAKDRTVWALDRDAMIRIPYYHRSCWPVRKLPVHSCCASVFERKVVGPILMASMGRDGRSRTMIHDVPESEILEALAEYGIVKDMLPTTMGGTIDLDEWLSEFIAQRRAIEMEEI